MSLSIFNAKVIEVLTDAKSGPWFKRADLGRFLGIVDVRHNFKNIATVSRSEIAVKGGVPPPPYSKVKTITMPSLI